MANSPAVCHIPPVNQIKQPAPHNVNSVAPAQPNIESLTATVNQLRQLLLALLNRKQQWVEFSRVTENVKVTNPSDPTQFVVVNRINQLRMIDQITGFTWEWNRTRQS